MVTILYNSEARLFRPGGRLGLLLDHRGIGLLELKGTRGFRIGKCGHACFQLQGDGSCCLCHGGNTYPCRLGNLNDRL